jgi:hypothetical protein
MSRFKIKVKVELVECDDFEQGDLTVSDQLTPSTQGQRNMS